MFMTRGKGVVFMAVLLSIFLMLGLGGCTDEPQDEPEPVDGGTTIRTDEDAPKVIESKDITGLDVNLYLASRWSGDEEHFFQFRIAEQNGTLTASESFSGVSLPADEALLTALQDVIDRYELAKRNGVYEVTAGLPPEFQERTLSVAYASGETLRFTQNNEPFEDWAVAFYDVFADWFAARGDESLYPDKETSLVSRIDVRLKENGQWFEFGGINVLPENTIEGETYLLQREVYDEASQTVLEQGYRLFPDEYYEKITEILAAHDVVKTYEFSYYDPEAGDYGNHDEGYYGFGSKTTADGEEDSDDLYLDLYVEYESGRRMTIETRKASEIEGLRPLLADLTAYIDRLFAAEEQE